MEKRVLGKTGIEVTKLCFGSLPMGPLQKNLSIELCTNLVSKALEKGINFIDTAQLYRTYEPIKLAIKKTGIRPIIATKSMANTYEDMKEAVEEALRELDLEYIDIFLIHAARADESVFEQKKDAIKCLLEYKEKGVIRAIGISTHSVLATSRAAQEEYIDVVFPIINIDSKGILGGTAKDMEMAIKQCADAGKGLYLMKILAGGNLVNDFSRAMNYGLSIKEASSIALGMVSEKELEYNIKYFEGVIDAEPSFEKYHKEFAVVNVLCIGCGDCVKICPNGCISMIDKKAYINTENCLQCGYCAGGCKSFAIRVV